MAVAVRDTWVGSGSGTTLTLSVPTGAQVGDLLVALQWYGSGGASGSPDDWDQYIQRFQATGTNTLVVTAKVYEEGDPSSWDWGVNTASGPLAMIALSGHAAVNLLSVDEATAEGGIGSWQVMTGSPTLASSAAQVFGGTKSLAITGTATESIQVITAPGTGGKPVLPSTLYYVSWKQRAAATGRSIAAHIRWYTSAGAFISQTLADTTTTLTTGWNTQLNSVTSPSNAAYAALSISYSTVSGDVQYFDNLRMCLDPVPTFSSRANASGTNGSTTINGVTDGMLLLAQGMSGSSAFSAWSSDAGSMTEAIDTTASSKSLGAGYIVLGSDQASGNGAVTVTAAANAAGWVSILPAAISAPTITAELYESGSLVAVLGSAVDVDADEVISWTWDAVDLSALSGANVELRLTSSEAIDIGAVEWNALREAGAVTHQLAGVTAGVSTVTGSLAVEHSLAGASAAVVTVVGALAAERPLAVVSAGTASVAGNVVVAHPLAAVSTAVVTVTGDVVVTHPLEASSAGVTVVSGDLLADHLLAGATAGVSSTAAAMEAAAAAVEVWGMVLI